MDPLSVAANVLAVAAAASKLVSLIEDLWSLRHVPAQALALMNELSDLRAVLDVVNEAFHTDGSSESAIPPDTLKDINRGVISVKQQLEGLEELVLTRLVKRTGGNPLERGTPNQQTISKRSWLKNRTKIWSMQGQIRASRDTIMFALVGLNTVEQKTHKRILLNIQNIVQTIDNRAEISDKVGDNGTIHIEKLIDQVTNISLEPVREVRDNDSSTTPTTESSGDKSKSPSAPHSDSSHDGMPIRVNATLASLADKCDPFCSCQCHMRTESQTPRWLHFLVGTLFYSSTVLPVASPRPCNVISCHRSGSGSTRLSYFFPSWAVARVLYISKSWRALNAGDATWTIKMPRVVSEDALVWQHLKSRDIHGIRSLFDTGMASPYDVDKMGSSVLHKAMTNGDYDIALYLMEAGADRNLKDQRGLAASSLAWDVILATGIHTDIAVRLQPMVEDDDLVDTMQFTALHLITAGLTRNTDITRFIGHTATLAARDGWGRTALHWASIRRQPRLVEALLEAGADPNRTSTGGDTPLHLLAWGVEDEPALRATELLLRAGADPNVLNMYGQSSLHAAVWERRTPHAFVGLLLDAGADVDIYAEDVGSPLHRAVLAGSIANIEYLISRGADVEHRDARGRTCLLKAVRHNHTDVMKLLLAQGARVDAISGGAGDDSSAETLLHVAARFADVKLLRAMTSDADLTQLDPEVLDGRGRTPAESLEEVIEANSVPQHTADERRQALQELVDAVREAKKNKEED